MGQKNHFKESRNRDFEEWSTNQKIVEEKELIIPLIHANRWRGVRPDELEKEADEDVAEKDEKTVIKAAKSGDEITDKAVQELIAASKRQSSNEQDESVIPLLLRNKVPNGYETDDKLDVTLRPDEASPADYDAIPIECYGMAMLRGMGFDPKAEKGKRPQPINAIPRPKGLGLGADRSMLLKKTGQVNNGAKEQGKELQMKTGAYCVIEKGKQDGMYGQIDGLDEDNVRAFVRLAVGDESITISQLYLRLVTKEDYKKNSKYLNKSKADKYKMEADKKPDGDREEKHSRKRRSRDRSRSRSHERDRSREKESKKRHKHSKDDERYKEKRQHKQDDDDRRKSHKTSSKRSWLQPHLRVRIIDSKYKKGRYYKSKVTIEDVIGPGICMCRTDDDKVLDELNEDQLETVIPRHEPSYVMIIKGQHKSQLGEILDRSKSKCTASVQLLSDRDCLLTLSFDDVCEYTGDIHAQQDY